MSNFEQLTIDWLLRSAVVFLVIGFGLFCCRKWASPALRFIVLQVTFFAMCLMPFIPQVGPTVAIFPRVELLASEAANSSISAALKAESQTGLDISTSRIEVQRETDNFPALAIIWISGSMLLFVRLGWSAMSLARRGRRTPFQVKNRVCIVFGKSQSRPMAWGICQPMVSLPPEAEHWQESTREAVVAHEIAHHSRQDPFWVLLSEIVVSVAWFNPFLWLLRAWQNIERERATDDLVITQRTVKASDYAEALTRLADKRWSIATPMAPAIAMGAAFRLRVERTLDHGVPRAIPGWRGVISIAVSILAIVAVTSLLSRDVPKKIELQVVIDPGHGAYDSGAKRGGFVEKDLNLSLSNVVANYLQECGVHVVMTRQDDAFLTLRERAAFAEKAAVDFEGETVLVSIHHNASRNTDKSGIELYILEGDEKSATLGKSIESSFRSKLGAEMVYTRPARSVLLKEAKIPRVKIEAGYLSNPGDLAKVTSDEYRDLMGAAIAAGIFRRSGIGTAVKADRPLKKGLAGGFDYPVGNGEATGFYTTKGFEPNGHLGDDFNGIGGGNSDLGLPVTSIGDGIVIFAKDARKGWGNVVITRHQYRDPNTGKVETIDALYGHLESMDVKRDEQIVRGQTIGTIGRGPYDMYSAHLHLEIRKNLEIGLDRDAFSRGAENYHSPTRFIANHRPGMSAGLNVLDRQ